jgi:hypothetical protein
MIYSPPFPFTGREISCKSIAEWMILCADNPSALCDQLSFPHLNDDGSFPPGVKLEHLRSAGIWEALATHERLAFLMQQYDQAKHYLEQCAACFQIEGVENPRP